MLHRLPLEAAYKRGYFDQEMNQTLSDPTDDTKGFFDPNTHENLTYLQLMERCMTDPETGLCLLPLTDRAAKGGDMAYTDQEAKDVFKKATVSAPFGTFKGKTVTIWEIINSEYFTEEQRRDLLRQYKTGKITVEKIIKIVITVFTLYDALKKNLLKPEAALPLLEAQAGTGYIIDPVRNEKLSVDEAVRAGIVGPEFHEKLLSAEKAVTGYKDPYTGQTVSLFQALRKGLIPSDTGIRLLDVQLATGGIVDPVNSHRLPLDVACKRGYFDEETNKALSTPSDDTKDPYSGNTISLFEAMKKGLILKEHGIRLLEAQIATGGIVDPVHSHRACFGSYHPQSRLNQPPPSRSHSHRNLPTVLHFDPNQLVTFFINSASFIPCHPQRRRRYCPQLPSPRPVKRDSDRGLWTDHTLPQRFGPGQRPLHTSSGAVAWILSAGLWQGGGGGCCLLPAPSQELLSLPPRTSPQPLWAQHSDCKCMLGLSVLSQSLLPWGWICLPLCSTASPPKRFYFASAPPPACLFTLTHSIVLCFSGPNDRTLPCAAVSQGRCLHVSVCLSVSQSVYLGSALYKVDFLD
uniref:Uncharacterized protein n=1 Tax=Chelydra serpentina TaxID=8475 RepID=A0A8C3T4A3_CHESE